MRHPLVVLGELCKVKILLFVIITVTMGFFLGGRGEAPLSVLAITILGTTLCCGGGAILNQVLEIDTDTLMHRTRSRPLVVGEVGIHQALILGVSMALCGTSILVSFVNLLTGFIALLTVFLYVIVYTPLKRVTWLNTAIGAIPGALPPMGGWTAAYGSVEPGAWLLFFILFLWQHPHFFAIAWMYRDDYSAAGLRMLPVVDPSGKRAFRQSLVFGVLLIVASLVPALYGVGGIRYTVFVLVLGGLFLLSVWSLCRSHSHQDARTVLRTSLIYLPALLLALLVDVPLYDL